jgi:hypothetical protein
MIALAVFALVAILAGLAIFDHNPQLTAIGVLIFALYEILTMRGVL